MWHILRAEPGAKIALGLREAVTRKQLRGPAESRRNRGIARTGFPSEPGDTFFAPAGTIHAIGGGLAICEVQQPSRRHLPPLRLWPARIANCISIRRLPCRISNPYARARTPATRAEPECWPIAFPHRAMTVNGSVQLPARGGTRSAWRSKGKVEFGGLPFRAGEAGEVPARAEAVRDLRRRRLLLITREP